MIRRKYFRPEPEVNLLTWDAKAQMRYLHATDPDTWTPQQLAESFPISAEGRGRECPFMDYAGFKDNLLPQDQNFLVLNQRKVFWRNQKHLFSEISGF